MTDALFKLYTRDILRLAGGITRVGKLNDADGVATRTSRLCGSVMTVEVSIANGRIADYAHRIQACAFGQASAALFAEVALGRSAGEVDEGCAGVEAFLNGSPAPVGVWSGFECLAPVCEVTARHGAVLLPFETTLAAIQAVT
ncbi:MAG: iron-sulfur cluster assembly scaffold protein [Alphaproteobacteria bacterium]|nr:iron-sulfur cluster assembly scaffold protein [Alphaproteobacteria bacterium]